MALIAKAIAHLATIVKVPRSYSVREAAENGELRRWVNDMKEKTLEAVLSEEQLQATVSAMTEELDV